MNKRQRLFALLLCASLLVGMFPGFGLTAKASGNYPWENMSEDEFTQWVYDESNREYLIGLISGEDEEAYDSLLTVMDSLEEEERMALTTFLSSFFYNEALAKPITLATSGNIAQRLDSLRKKFPDGKYWNHATNSSHNHLGAYESCTSSSCNNPDGVTDHPCTTHVYSVGSGSYDCNNFDGGIQCMGFARKVFYDVFGEYASTHEKLRDTSNVQPGDFIRLLDDKHSAVVLSRSGNYVTVVEANLATNPPSEPELNCKIRWDATYSISSINYYIHASNYDIINGTDSYSTISPGKYALKNKYSNDYLTLAENSDKDLVSFVHKGFDSTLSAFNLNTTDSKKAYELLPIISTSRVVNPYADTPTNGTAVNLYHTEKENAFTQRWHFEKKDGYYIIRLQSNPSLVLTTNTNGKIYVNTYAGTNDQMWELEDLAHVHAFTIFSRYDSAHPHYNYYKCACGIEHIGTTTQSFVDGCADCLTTVRPSVSTLSIPKTSFLDSESIPFTWTPSQNATHYGLQIYTYNNGDWEPVNDPYTVESGVSKELTAGRYKANIIAYNYRANEPDTGLYLHSESNSVEFIVEHNYILTNSTQTGNSKVDTYTCDGCNDTYTKTTEITPDYIAQGTCGENASWTLDKDGLLTISGTGSISSLAEGETHWNEYGNQIKRVQVLPGITSIGSRAFLDCDNLITVELPEGLISIQSLSFAWCDNLETINLPDSITTLGSNAFQWCTSLDNIVIPAGIHSISEGCFNGAGITHITIPENVTSIKNYAFAKCAKLESIFIPAWVTSIGFTVMNNCQSMTNILVDPANPNYTAFNGALLNKEMTTLYAYAAGKTGEYVIPDSVRTISAHAFIGCAGLTAVTLPSDLETLDVSAFNGCSSLREIAIPDGITSISASAFLGCTNLATVTIPNSVTFVDAGAFYECGIVDVYYQGTQEQWNQITFANYGENTHTSLLEANIHFLRSSEPAQGQTDISCLVQEITVGDTAPVNVNVYLEESNVFAAAEIVLQFDDAKLQFNEAASTLNGAAVKVENGLLTLENYGTDKSCGVGSYVLSFDALTDGEAQVTLVSAAFSEKENAVHSDLVVSQVSETGLTLIVQKQSVSVTLPEIFTGPTSVTLGQDYTFRAADSIHFDYAKISAIMGGESAVITDNQDGTYTIAAVSGPIIITGTRTPKQYSVSFAGNGAEDITDGAASAVYGTDYSFTMPSALGWSYYLESITVNGTALTEYSAESSVYTIPGSAITGAVIITVAKEQAEVIVTVEGSGASAAEGYAPSVQIGTDYTLTLHPLAGYQYTVTAAMGGETVEVTSSADNAYTVASVTADLVFTVERQVITTGLKISKFLTLDGTNMWLVLNQTGTAENNVPTYDGQPMYYAEKYQAYCWIVIAPTLEIEDAERKLGFTIGEAALLEEDMDVNRSGKVDANDAQLVYNMYNTMYDAFTNDVTVQKFLLADVNGDTLINVADATAIVESLLN